MSLFSLVGDTATEVEVAKFIIAASGSLLTGRGATPKFISGFTLRIDSAIHGPCTHIAASPFAKAVDPATLPTSKGRSVPFAIIISIISNTWSTSAYDALPEFISFTKSGYSEFTTPPRDKAIISWGIHDS